MAPLSHFLVENAVGYSFYIFDLLAFSSQRIFIQGQSASQACSLFFLFSLVGQPQDIICRPLLCAPIINIEMENLQLATLLFPTPFLWKCACWKCGVPLVGLLTRYLFFIYLSKSFCTAFSMTDVRLVLVMKIVMLPFQILVNWRNIRLATLSMTQ